MNMTVTAKAAKVREAFRVIASESDVKTSEAIEEAMSACGVASLARLHDLILSGEADRIRDED